MSLNIKREETYHLAQELAHLTGESVTVAVTRAVRERPTGRRQQGIRSSWPLGHHRGCHWRQEHTSLADHLLAIGEDCATDLKEPCRSIDGFAYALAKIMGEPLLFKGSDFTHTDVSPALGRDM